MNHKPIPIALVIVLVILILLAMIRVMPVSAQASTPTPSVASLTPTPELEHRISELENKAVQFEIAQNQSIKSLEATNEQSKFLLTAFGTFIAVLVTIQGLATFYQLRREAKRDDQQSLREGQRDKIEQASVAQVSDIMRVVKETLESRLDAEKQWREEANKTRIELERVLNEVKSLDRFVRNFQSNIQNARQAIEGNASRLAQIPRHDFKSLANELNGFARQFDAFGTEYEPLEEEPRPQFSAKALYIRGIAAHYSNQPERAKQYLNKVAALQQPEQGDTDRAYKRRIANAYYYLGITESNFGNTQGAIDAFEHANSLDPESADFLTKIVTAEAYVMSGPDEFTKAEQIISEIEEGLRRKREREKEGRLAGVYLRLHSRALLVRVNMTFLRGAENWEQEAKRLLEVIHDDNPSYYFATATLAQVYAIQGNHDEARELFREAYETIEHSGELLTGTEARSQILLQMVAGLCCRHGLMNNKRSDEHLDKVDNLRDNLPKVDSQVCTVFSTLSKRNEKSETIHDHIELIRKGKVLLIKGE